MKLFIIISIISLIIVLVLATYLLIQRYIDKKVKEITKSSVPEIINLSEDDNKENLEIEQVVLPVPVINKLPEQIICPSLIEPLQVVKSIEFCEPIKEEPSLSSDKSISPCDTSTVPPISDISLPNPVNTPIPHSKLIDVTTSDIVVETPIVTPEDAASNIIDDATTYLKYTDTMIEPATNDLDYGTTTKEMKAITKLMEAVSSLEDYNMDSTENNKEIYNVDDDNNKSKNKGIEKSQ